MLLDQRSWYHRFIAFYALNRDYGCTNLEQRSVTSQRKSTLAFFFLKRSTLAFYIIPLLFFFSLFYYQRNVNNCLGKLPTCLLKISFLTRATRSLSSGWLNTVLTLNVQPKKLTFLSLINGWTNGSLSQFTSKGVTTFHLGW